MENSIIYYIKKHSKTIVRLICSFIVLWVFIIAYGETEYQTAAGNIILATACKYDIEKAYCIYIKPIAIYSVPILGCIYAVLLWAERHVVIGDKWKRWAALMAMVMAFWRVLSDSYTWVLSINLFWNNKIITIVLILGNFIIFYNFISLLLSAFPACREGNGYNCTGRPLCNLEECVGKHRIFVLIWLLFLISWLPRLVLNYPMAFDWDAGKILHTALEGVDYGYPKAQVMILKLVYQLGCLIGSAENGFFIYMCMKYLLSTLLFAVLMFYFQQKKCMPYIWYIVLGILLWCPIFQSWSIYITKDSNYSICFVGLIWSVCILTMDKEFVSTHKVLWGIMTFVFANGVFWLRGNGVYIDIVFLIAGLISFMDVSRVKQRLKKVNGKKWRRIAIICTMAGLALGIFALAVYTVESENGKTIAEVTQEDNDINGLEDLGQHGKRYLQFYIYRLGYFFRSEAFPRYAAAARQDCPEAVIEILGDDLPVLFEMEYTAANGAQPALITDIAVDRQNALMKYIIRNEPVVFIESIIAKIHGYFNLYSRWVPTYEAGISQGVYQNYGLEKYFKNEDEWWLRARSTVAAYNVFQNIPILGLTCHTGIYVWLMIATSIYLLIVRGRKVLCMLAPCWLTLMGAMVSGYNAYMRLSLPFVFSIPVLLLICTVNHRES